jgi:hypothetical protein
MITVKHPEGTLVVDSRYDSGTHLGFTVNLVEENSFNQKSLDELLTSKEIKSLEMILASVVKGYLEEK